MAVDRKQKPYGSTIENGKIRYWSASSLQLGDASGGEGCLRKWFYEKILGKRGPDTKAQQIGIELHAQNETYLKTGVNALGSLAMRGKHMLPKPGPDLLIEHDLVIPLATEWEARALERSGQEKFAEDLRSKARLEDAPLKLLDIPVFGYIDLAHSRCTNQGATEFEEAVDPENTAEVLDWKTTSNEDYIKTPQEMASTVQMTLYGNWVMKAMPHIEHVRLSHGYYVTRGSASPRKVSLRVLPERLEKQWERPERIAREILDVMQETDPDKVPGNKNACGSFGGCPHRSYCTAGTQGALATFFGVEGAARIAEAARNRKNQMTSPLNLLGRKGGIGALGKPAEAAPTAPPSVDDLHAEMKRLAVEEALHKCPQAQEYWEIMSKCPDGRPKFGGALAEMWVDLGVVEATGGVNGTADGVIPGVGLLGSEGPFCDLADLEALVTEMQSRTADTRPAPTIDPPAVIASEVPKRGRGRPRKNPLPPAVVAPAAAAENVVAPVASIGTQLVFDQVTADAAVSFDEGVKVIEGALGASDAGVEVCEAAFGDSNMKDANVIAATESFSAVASPVLETPRPMTVTQMSPTTVQSSTFFYVDAIPSCPYISFWSTVNRVLDAMSREADLPDMRLAGDKHPLSFGRWKTALLLGLQMEDLEPGHYVFDSTNSELCQVVIEAMRTLMQRKGGVFVRGMK